jgi:predicted nucleic acid-binding protein
VITALPQVDLSPDPWDNFLLALAEAGGADFLVTGDKTGLLALGRHATASIVTVRDMLDRLS